MTDTVSTNRRHLLFGLAAASTAAATGASAQATRAEPENPALLHLAHQLPDVEGEYLAAFTADRKLYREVQRVWPEAPDEIISFGLHSDLERDVAGAGLSRVQGSRPKSLGKPEAFADEQAYIRKQMAKKSKMRSERQRAEWRSELASAEQSEALAKDYWSECERLRETSGYPAVHERLSTARDALRNHVNTIMAEQETTMAGVLIKAQALAAWGKVEHFYRALNIDGVDWGASMASAVMRQAGTETSAGGALTGKGVNA